MGKDYQNKLFIFLSSIERDLRDNKINEKQFNFLLGFFLKTELNNIVKNEITSMMPPKQDLHKMTLLTYN